MSTTFLLTSLVIVAIPGTGALFTIAAGLVRGPRASLVAAFGCTLGIVPHMVAAITGAAALLQASGEAFQILKALGVLYLLYMAWATWRDQGVLTVDTDAAPRSSMRVVGSAILINLLNPKLTIFFFAFLPQFVSVNQAGATARMLGLGLVFMAMTFLVFTGYGLFASTLRRHLIERPHVIARVRKIFALSFVALGAKLATTDR